MPGKLLVSWRIENAGQFGTNTTFSIEVRFDGLAVATWTAQGLANNRFIFVDRVADLLEGMEIEAGTHEVSLVIDSLDTVNESVESDNIVSRVVTMSDAKKPERPADELPNLLPYPHPGKVEPVFASSHPDDRLSGKLTIDRPSAVALGVINRSVQYVTQHVDVYLLIDDRLVRTLTWENLAPDGQLRFSTENLQERVEISPGPHTLRVIVDPLNRIQESDETDNEYEVELTWGTGEPPAAEARFVPVPPEREPTTRANLTPFRPFGWDAAIVAFHRGASSPTGKDGRLDVEQITTLQFAFSNQSRFSLPLTDRLTADVLLDGTLISSINFDSGASNVGVMWQADVLVPAGSLSPGEHTVRVVLDPDQLFDELSKSDNTFERVFTWHPGPETVQAPPFEMSDEEISNAFAPLFDELRYEMRPVVGRGAGERDWTPEVIAAGRAAYFLLTGRDLEDEGYAIHFLPLDEFHVRRFAACMSRWVTLRDSEYESTFERCSATSGEIGFKTRSNGQVHLFIDMGFPPMNVLGTFLHELGHALQDLEAPSQTTTLPRQGLAPGLFEAQAQAFEAAGWRAIEEFTGKSLSSFPGIPTARETFEDLFDVAVDRGTEHDLGYQLLWTYTLSGGAGARFTDELRSSGKLSSNSIKSVFDGLVEMPAGEVSAILSTLLSRTDLMDEFRGIASLRMVAGLPAADTGHPALMDATWLAP